MKLQINQRGAFAIFQTIIFILLLFAAQSAQADTYTVSNTNEFGAGSLRVAMLEANATPIADTIVFDIPGGGVHTITPTTFLPLIEYSLTIDGTTQPGFAGVPLIEINAVNTTHGLNFNNTGLNDSRTYIVKSLIINRASDDGIHMESNGTFERLNATITGCYIGTNASGTLDLGNGGDGIEISASNGNSVIGGTALGQRNVISGNGSDGIESRVTDTLEIYNNYIGTNAAGTADLGNGNNGIYVFSGQADIGGTASGGANRGNVISGNNIDGIRLSSNYSTVQRNLIGTNAAGTADLGNSIHGIRILGANHLIGSSTSSSDGNTISGNGVNGIFLSGVTSGAQIFGNRIGTAASGSGDLGNDGSGIEIEFSNNAQIGLAGNNTARNIISRNDLHGIFLNGATGNHVENNFIGTNASGTALGNGGDGVSISNGGANVIGGAAANSGNTIALNLGNGVNVSSAVSTGNLIRHNAMYSNEGLGINLGANGVTANDVGDADTGANDLQNFPVLQNASPSRIAGTLNSLANQTYTIDFYRVDSCDPAGNGEGRYHLASTNIVTVGNSANFNFAYLGLTIGQRVTATATDAGGNTSEFSQCLIVTQESGDLQFSSATYSRAENAGSVLITVNRVGGAIGTITVDYSAANGTATAGADFAATNGTLTFTNGETAKTFSVPITDDTMDEPNETFNVILSNPTGGAQLLNPSSAVVTITDNDNPPTISIADVSQAEGNSGITNYTFTVALSQASGFDVSVNYATANNTATAGIDYAPTSGTLSFSSISGETSKLVTVAVNGDLLIEINETFFVNLSNPTNATFADAQSLGTITDDDNPGRLQFAASPYATAEGGTAVVTVVRTGGAAGTATVDFYTANGTATPTIDYQSAAGTLVFLDGETSKELVISTLQDTQVEPTENFNIILTNPLGGATLGALAVTNVNILDEDGGDLLSIGGRILKTDFAPLAGAVVNLQGTQTASVTTDANGDFNFSNIAPGGSFTVTPAALGFTFDPAAREYLILAANVANANFTATAAPNRQLRIIGGDASPGNPVHATVELVAQGDENSLGFSLNFDAAILSGANIVLNPDAGAAALTTNSSQTGKIGVLLALPAGQSFTAGTKSLVTITFNTNAATTAHNSPVIFGDVPVARQIANANANVLPANYVNGQVTFAQGYEADVSPRPTGSGNGTVTVADFSLIGNFVAGLATPNQLNEFQRADSSPRISKGNGALSVADYTQAARYAAGLDIVQTAGGETAPSGLFDCGLRIAGCESDDPKSRISNSAFEILGANIVRVVNASGSPNTQVLVSIETIAGGTENGFGFSLNYDAAKLGNPLVSLGADTPGASLISNTNTAGRVGVVLGMPFGQALPAGTRQLVTIRFNILPNASGGQTLLAFGDLPVVREVADTDGNTVPATFQDGYINILVPTAANVSISGRVLTATGGGISKAQVVLTDANGASWTAITSSFGWFCFEQVPAGATYIVEVRHKKYQFAPRVLAVLEDISDLDLTAENQ